MSDEKRGLQNLTSQLVIPVALVVVVGIAQIMFAVRVLTDGKSASWFLMIMVVGVLLNMGIIVYTVSSLIRSTERVAAIETSNSQCRVSQRTTLGTRALYLVV